jgi:uncharacterized protein YndB with AHSA1/START domain
MIDARRTAPINDRKLVIARVFDAPREPVFRAWTEPALFARWFGPHGTVMPFCEMDPRPGGGLRFCYLLPNGDVHRIVGRYREVVKPERLVFTESFTDERGTLIERSGFPLVALLTVTFAEQGGRTRLTIHHAGVDWRELPGWTTSLTRLARYVGSPDGDSRAG